MNDEAERQLIAALMGVVKDVEIGDLAYVLTILEVGRVILDACGKRLNQLAFEEDVRREP